MSGFTLPTSRPITQAWGAEFDDWDGDGVVDYPGGFYHSIGWDGHNGIDYRCYEGDPVEAVADGIVAFAGDAGNWHAILSGGGNAILIEHPGYGVQTEYLHLSRWLVEAGQTVRRGKVIGYSGKTGAATAPHLHLGMLKLRGYNLADRWRGRIDPTPWLYGNLNPDYAGSAAIAPQGTTTPIGGLSMADINSITKQLADIQAKLAPIKTDGGDVSLRQFIADGTRAAQAAEKQTGPINVSGGQEGIRDFIAKGTRAAQSTAAQIAGLQAALKAVIAAGGSGVDLEAVTAAAEKGATKALANLDLTGTISIGGK